MTTELYSKYFVLKPAGSDVFARASRKAMLAYANYLKNDEVEGDSTENDAFADEIIAWARDEFGKYIEAMPPAERPDFP